VIPSGQEEVGEICVSSVNGSTRIAFIGMNGFSLWSTTGTCLDSLAHCGTKTQPPEASACASAQVDGAFSPFGEFVALWTDGALQTYITPGLR
jgi:hypothetical protein